MTNNIKNIDIEKNMSTNYFENSTTDVVVLNKLKWLDCPICTGLGELEEYDYKWVCVECNGEGGFYLYNN